MKKIKNDKAITLVALVVTIIILLILAGVTVGLATNGTGLFEKAKLATDEYNNKAQQEETELVKATNEINDYIDGNRDTINNYYGMFIDTSKLLATIAKDSAYNTNSYYYTASENCIVVGDVYANGAGAGFSILINDVQIGYNYNNSDINISRAIYYPLAKGDKIEIRHIGDEGDKTYKTIYVYGVK